MQKSFPLCMRESFFYCAAEVVDTSTSVWYTMGWMLMLQQTNNKEGENVLCPKRCRWCRKPENPEERTDLL